jgi:hypothetical protein
MWGDTKFPRDTWNEEKVLKLFNSELGPKARGAKSGYIQIVNLLCRKELMYEYLAIPCCSSPARPQKGKIKSTEWHIFRQAGRGGGDLHSWLKWWAYNWLTELGGTPAEFEVTFTGYGRVDLYSRELAVFLECGNISPDHALYALRSCFCLRFVVLPFQRAALESACFASSRKLEAVSFSLAPS